MTPPLRFQDTALLEGATVDLAVSLCQAKDWHRRRRISPVWFPAPFDGAGTGGAG